MQILNVAGAKTRLAPWIISHLPPHQLYCEPFGGSAAVLLAKERSELEVYNDVDREFVLFFQTLASKPELVEAIDGCLYSAVIDEKLTENTVELARRFFQANNTTWSHSQTFKTQKRVGERKRTLLDRFEERKRFLDRVAKRIRGVIFECRDGIELIRKYDGPEVLFYVDPPYFGKRKKNLYRHEMMDEESHRALAAVLRQAQGAVVLSSCPSELYEELYGGWELCVRDAQTNAKDLRQECLWIKPQHLNGVAVKAKKRARKLKWAANIFKAVRNSEDGLSFGDLYRLQIPKESLHRTLRCLESQKYLYQDSVTKTWKVMNGTNKIIRGLLINGTDKNFKQFSCTP